MLRLILWTMFACLVALESPQAQDSGVLLRVIDGDTIKVQLNGTKTTVRLIGIDAAESTVNEKALRDARESDEPLANILERGRIATKFLRQLAPTGTVLRFEYDREKYDKYGRVLAYAFLPDGRMLQEVLLRAKQVRPYLINSHTLYGHRFEHLGAQASLE